MAWPRAILTDSGGFQVFSLNAIRKVTEEGVLFHSHLNGDPHFFSPEGTVDIQLSLGSDIQMVLDECLSYPATHADALRSMRRTVRWAQAAYAHYRAAEKSQYSALFPIVQGSMYPDLRHGLRGRVARAGRAGLRDRRIVGRRAARSEPGNGRAHRAATPKRPASLRHGRRACPRNCRAMWCMAWT